MKSSFKITEYKPMNNGICWFCGLNKEFHEFNICPSPKIKMIEIQELKPDGKCDADVLPYSRNN